MIPALLSLLLLQAPADGRAMSFAGPEGATREVLEKAAAVLAKRCEGVGFKGITTKVVEVEGRVRIALESATKMGKTQQDLVARLGVLKGENLELRLTWRLGPDELKQFRPPKDGDAGTAPAGAQWFPKIAEDGATGWILMRTVPAVKPIPKLEIPTNTSSGDRDCYYEIPAGDTPTLRANPLVRSEAAMLLLDGKVFDGPGKLDFGAVQFGRPLRQARYHLGFRPQIFDASLRFPLPVTLTCIKG